MDKSLIGDKYFPVLGGKGSLSQEGLKSGEFSIFSTDALAAPSASFSNVFTIQSNFKFKIKGFSSRLDYYSMGGTLAVNGSHVVTIAPNVSTSQNFYSIPGRFDAAGSSSAIATSYQVFCSAERAGEYQPVHDVVLEANSIYQIGIGSDYRAWVATDVINTWINIHWEQV